MFLLGILGILQMVILPGVIINGLFKFHSSLLIKIIFIFGSSLASNYFLVLLLVTLNIFTQLTLLIIIFIEMLLIIWVFRKKEITSFETEFKKLKKRMMSIKIFDFNNSIQSDFLKIVEYFVYILLLIFAIVDVIWMARRFTNNLGTVFNSWDAVVSWNRWAVTWAQGVFPQTSYYPQLIPTNWAITYVLLGGASLQIFTKAIMPLFSLFILIMLLDLGLNTRSFGFFIGVIFTRLVIKNFTGEFISEGYMDLPATFFGFTCIYFLLKSRISSTANSLIYKLIISGSIFATASALTKQAGIFVLFVFPILALILIPKNYDLLMERKKRKIILISFACGIFVVLSWYLIKYVSIRAGTDYSNLSYVTRDIYGGAGYLERAVDAFALLGKYGLLLLLVVPTIIVIEKPYRWLSFVFVIPYSLIWIFFFGYEVRNLALIFPVWGMLLGFLIQKLFDYFLVVCKKMRIQKTPVVVIPILLAIAVIGGVFFFPSSKLIEIENAQLWSIFNPELNSKIRELGITPENEIKVLTNYPIDYLPGLAGTKIGFSYDNYDDYLWAMNNYDIKYLLVPKIVDEKINEKIQIDIQNNLLTELFTEDGAYSYTMIKVLE